MKMFKKIIGVAFVVALNAIGYAVDVNETLLQKIAKVESNGKSTAIGDNGKALGIYQIWNSYISDVNAIYKTNYTHSDARDNKKAKDIVKKYLTHYGKVYEKKTGKKATNEVLSRIHNGGPNGYKSKATVKYWKKIKDA